MSHQTERMHRHEFELSGGVLCLDFANTWGNQADEGSDHLTDYAHVVEFGRQTGQLHSADAAALTAAAGADPAAAQQALEFARGIRASVYRLFSAHAACRDMPLADVERINSVLGQALSKRTIEPHDDAFEWGWMQTKEADLRSPVWPVVVSAATLLTSDDLGRVRECAADDCNWLFLDRSRSGSRRWCSMKSCGNRAKARRHYHRHQKSAKGGQ